MERRAYRTYTPEEYLAMEEAAEYKSEYRDGQIVAMSGGSRDHSIISGNIHNALYQALLNNPCEVHGSDLRVLVERAGLYTYPDVMVICGRPQFAPKRTDTVTNPVLIVEVLSPSTRDYDRVEKFRYYKQLNSLQEYLLVDSERVHVTRLAREGTNKWTIEMFDDLEDVIQLQSVDFEMPLRRMYIKVEFEEQKYPSGFRNPKGILISQSRQQIAPVSLDGSRTLIAPRYFQRRDYRYARSRSPFYCRRPAPRKQARDS